MNSSSIFAETKHSQHGNNHCHGSLFHALLYTVFQKPREDDGRGIAIAISSPNPGEGVTFVSRTILQELGRSTFNSVAGVNMSFLRKLHEPTLEAIRESLAGSDTAATGRSRGDFRKGDALTLEEKQGPWEGSWRYRRDCIDLLRSEFDYSIIDCPSLKVSSDLLSVAPFVDGVILVIEANSTHRDEPRQAEQCVAGAGGRVLGFILNKRTYCVPLWLERAL